MTAIWLGNIINTLDLSPLLQRGINKAESVVRRCFAASRSAMPFCRTASSGLLADGGFLIKMSLASWILCRSRFASCTKTSSCFRGLSTGVSMLLYYYTCVDSSCSAKMRLSSAHRVLSSDFPLCLNSEWLPGCRINGVICYRLVMSALNNQMRTCRVLNIHIDE